MIACEQEQRNCKTNTWPSISAKDKRFKQIRGDQIMNTGSEVTSFVAVVVVCSSTE